MTASRLALTVERLPDGGLRFTSPTLLAWTVDAHGPYEIARALDAGWVEADIAAYAHARGTCRDVEAWDDTLRGKHSLAELDDTSPDFDITPRLRVVNAATERVAASDKVTAIRTRGQRELAQALLWQRNNLTGRWLSPAGRWFVEHSVHVQRVLAILTEHGEAPQVYRGLHAVHTDAEVHPISEARARRARRQAGAPDGVA